MSTTDSGGCFEKYFGRYGVGVGRPYHTVFKLVDSLAASVAKDCVILLLPFLATWVSGRMHYSVARP